MLKVALIVMVIVSVAVITYLLWVSFKLLRQTEKQQSLEKKQTIDQYQLHPKLKKKDDPDNK